MFERAFTLPTPFVSSEVEARFRAPTSLDFARGEPVLNRLGEDQ